MNVGLLPTVRGGLALFARTGQRSRLVDGYLTPYARAFDEVWYFSYLAESLGEPALEPRVRLVPAPPQIHPWVYAGLLPVVRAPAFRRCHVLRVFQLTGVLPALVARRLHGTPFVTTYGFWYEKLAGSPARARVRRLLERVGLPAAAAVIVTTEQLRAHVVRRVPPERVRLVPNGVDTTTFVPVPRKRRDVREVVYVGRLSAEKNVETVVEALGKLGGRHAVRLTVVGDGPCREAILSAAKHLAVDVRLLGFVDHRRLPALLADADVFVLPSLTEGHPKALLEAMSTGLPCLASDVDGNRAVVAPGETGLLFDPRDASGLADALDRVFTDGELARRLGKAARVRAVEAYDLGRLVAGEIALLTDVAARGGPPATP